MTTTPRNKATLAVEAQEQYAHNAQEITKRLATAQARNVKYTQSIFENTMALLKSNLEDTRSMVEQWGSQATPEVSKTYMNLFTAPFTAYQQTLEGLEAASRQMFDTVESASRQMFEGVESASRQMFEGMENPTKKSFENFQKVAKSFEHADHSK